MDSQAPRKTSNICVLSCNTSPGTLTFSGVKDLKERACFYGAI